MSEELIQTLDANPGKNPGEAIASYGRSIVFLPGGTGTAPGTRVRVKLIELGKTDSRGRTMYRGVPAHPEYTEKWKDNKDGTATKVTISTDWLGKQVEEGEVETRALETREYPDRASERTDRAVVWGSDLATSAILKEQVRTIPTLAEQVDFQGTVSLKQVSTREERSAAETLPLIRVKVWAGDFDAKKLEVAYQDTWTLTADCYITDADYVRENSMWGKLPSWLKPEVQAQYPVCGCGRKRVAQNPDGYPKCEECRKEEVCIRCNKKSTVTNLGGRLVCNSCQPHEQAEQLIETQLPRERREAIAAEAKQLATGQALPQEAGETILKATLDHLDSQWRKDNLIQKWAGYGWYYFCDEGIYATKLAPAALQILQFLPQATGNGLVEMVVWLTGGLKPRDTDWDFYLRTQVKGESGMKPSITEDALKQLKVAEYLRGSEADRIAALAGYRNLVSKLGAESRETKAVAEILQEEKQDYAAALAKIREIWRYRDNRQKLIDAGEIWPDVSVSISTESRTFTEAWAIRPDGSIIEPVKEDTGGRKARICAYNYGDLSTNVLVVSHEHDNYHYQNTEVWEVYSRPQEITPAQADTVKRLCEESRHYFIGPGTGWNLSKVGSVVFTTAYHRDFEGREQELDSEMRSNLPIDVTQWETEVGEEGAVVVGLNRYAPPEHRAVRKAEEETQTLRGELMNLEHEQEDATAEYVQAEEEWLARQDAEHGQAPIEDGTVFLVPRFVKETSQGRESLAYGPFYDSSAGHQVKLILDAYSRESERITEASRGILVRVRARSSAQLHLFEGFLRPMDGGHKQKTFGYFVKAVLGPKDLDSRIKELEEKLWEAEGRLEKLKLAAAKIKNQRKQDTSIAEPQIQGSGFGTMADALKKAGLAKE